MNTDYISLYTIIDRLKMHPMLADVPEDTIIIYILELIQIMGCPALFEQKEAILDIENYRAKLPCDYFDMNQVALYRNKHAGNAFVYSTATFSPMSYNRTNKLSYKIQGNIIYTSLEKCQIMISYKAIKLDDNGYPLILNNAALIRAMESYIKMKWFTILFDQGKINDRVMQKAEQDYYADISSAQTKLSTPSIDQMESLKNIFTSMLDKPYGHETTFRDVNINTQIKVH